MKITTTTTKTLGREQITETARYKDHKHSHVDYHVDLTGRIYRMPAHMFDAVVSTETRTNIELNDIDKTILDKMNERAHWEDQTVNKVLAALLFRPAGLADCFEVMVDHMTKGLSAYDALVTTIEGV